MTIIDLGFCPRCKDEYGVEIYRNPKPLASKRLTYSQALRLIFSQSSTVCRLARKVEDLLRVQKNLDAQLKEYRNWKRLMEGRDGPTNTGTA